MKRRTLIFIALPVFLIGALLQLPAARIQGWIAPTLAAQGVGLSNLDGTLASGRLGQLEIRGQPAVSDLHWQLRTLGLLLGRAGVRLSGGADGLLVDGGAYVVPSGALTLHDLRVGAPLQKLAAAAGQPFLPVEGQVLADIERLRLRNRWPDQAQGLLTVRGLGWKLARDPVVLGDYEAQIETETGGIKATVRTLSGQLEITGEARARDDRSYELHLQMRPKPGAPPLIQNLVQNLGQPDTQGWYHLRRQGKVAAPPTSAPPAT